MTLINQHLQPFLGALRGLAPIVLVIAVFQLFALRPPVPNLPVMLTGFVCIFSLKKT